MDDRDLAVAKCIREVGVKAIITHLDPHPDELAAIIFARSKVGLQHFPGADKAPIEAWSKADPRLGRTCEEFAQEGILLIGIGGGPFDEHGTAQDLPKKGCASTLMAEFLGLDRVVVLQKFLKHIECNDNGQWGPFDLSTAIMHLYEECRPADPTQQAQHQQRCIQVGLALFSALINRELRLINEGAEAFAAAEVYSLERRGVRSDNGRVIRMAVGVTDVKSFPRYARSKMGNMADVVIVKSPTTGHISILTVGNQFDLTPLAQALRMRELQLRGEHLGHGWRELSVIGVYPDVPEWYLHDGRGMVLNSSRVRPDAIPTRIDLKQVVNMVEWVVGGWLPEFRECSCLAARRCFWQECPVYILGLPRCREYRQELVRGNP